MKRRAEDRRLFEEKLTHLLPLIREANISAEELKRDIEFKPVISQVIEDKPGLTPLEQLQASRTAL